MPVRCVVFWIIATLFGVVCQNALAQSYLIYPEIRLHQIGDQLEWSLPEWNDSDWQTGMGINHVGNFWVRFRLMVPGELLSEFPNPGLSVIASGSYELFWNGKMIANNGSIAMHPDSSERSGTFLSEIRIPDSLFRAGTHHIAMRMSNWNSTSIFGAPWNQIYLEDYRSTKLNGLRLTIQMAILAGLFLMAGFYHLLLYLIRKRELATGLFSLICFLFATLLFLEYAKFFIAYPYHWQFPRLILINLCAIGTVWATIIFLLKYFQISLHSLWFWVLLVLQVILIIIFRSNFDALNLWLHRLLWIGSVVVVLRAVLAKRKSASIVLMALLVAGFLVQIYRWGYRPLTHDYDVTIFISFTCIALAMMYVLALRARNQREAYERSLVVSTRLQNELLKKHIQPHFIHNTLTSLMGWIEESPNESIQMIEALAGEFDLIREMADQRVVPVLKEIELCHQHVKIMEYRKDLSISFETMGIDPEEEIPPALFHTLLENALTHGVPKSKDRTIHCLLRFQRTQVDKCYTFTVTGIDIEETTDVEEGTGTQYIKSRLTESYGNHWNWQTGPVEKGWATQIKIFE